MLIIEDNDIANILIDMNGVEQQLIMQKVLKGIFNADLFIILIRSILILQRC